MNKNRIQSDVCMLQVYKLGTYIYIYKQILDGKINRLSLICLKTQKKMFKNKKGKYITWTFQIFDYSMVKH